MPSQDLPRPPTVAHTTTGRTESDKICKSKQLVLSTYLVTWSSHRLEQPGHTGTRNRLHTNNPKMRGPAGAAEQPELVLSC